MKQGAGHSPCEIPVIAGARSGRYRRRAFFPGYCRTINELADASINYLRGEEFQLYPDFQTGGSIDVAKYNDGERGGAVKVRAKIAGQQKRLLSRKSLYGKPLHP